MRNRDAWGERKIPRRFADVYDARDPRHIGELRAVIHSALAVIVWNDTGWCSDDIRVRHVRAVADDAKAERAVSPPRQPKRHKRASDATLELYRRRKANREQENA